MLVLDLINQYCQFHFLPIWITALPAFSLLLKQDLWLRLLFRVFIPNLTPFSFLRNHFLPTVFISLKSSWGLLGHQGNLNLIVSWNRATLLRKPGWNPAYDIKQGFGWKIQKHDCNIISVLIQIIVRQRRKNYTNVKAQPLSMRWGELFVWNLLSSAVWNYPFLIW